MRDVTLNGEPMGPHKIIGLGVSGLGCALELLRHGETFDAYEREGRPGGLARSETVGGFRFDYGPHILTGIPHELVDLLSELDLELEQHSCESVIVLGKTANELVPTPLQRNLHRLPFRQRLRVLRDLVSMRWTTRRGRLASPRNYEEQAVATCGQAIYDLFLSGYERKRLRYDLRQIDARWTRRLSAPSFRALLGPDVSKAKPTGNGADGVFFYPKQGGIEALPRALVQRIPAGFLHYNKELAQIDVRARSLVFEDGRQDDFETLALSLPLPVIISLIKDAPTELRETIPNLIHTSVYVVNLGLDGPLACRQAILRYPDQQVDFYRVSVPSSYSRSCAPEGCSAVAVEISHHPTRHPLGREEALRASYRGLKEVGLLEEGRRVLVEQVNEIPHGHIIYNRRSEACVTHAREWLAEHGVFTCGKYGEWRDLLMPQSLLSGRNAARQAIRQRTPEPVF